MNIQLRDYQMAGVEKIRASFRNGCRNVLFQLPTGGGKCLGRNTPVLMYDGTTRKVQDVRVGEKLMGPDSLPRTVVSICRGQEMMYRVVPTKGMPYTVNESHILSLKITGMDCKVVSPIGRHSQGDVVNISVKDYLQSSKTFRHVAKGWRAAVDFPTGENNSVITPYILGVWLGDGTSRSASISNVDPEVLAEWARYADSINHGLSVKSSVDRIDTHSIISPEGTSTGRGHKNNLFLNELRRLCLIQNKHIPHVYKTGDRQGRLELLAGIIDTDGYLHNGSFDVVLKQRRLAMDVAFLSRSLGFAATIKQCRKTCTNTGATGDYYRVIISGDTDTVPCRVPRRQAQPRQQKKNVLLTGITVEPIGVDEYFGFELSGPDRLFLLGDFTVTHNTVVFCYITENAAKKSNRVLILVHRQELIRQTSTSLSDIGVPHGIIAPGFTPTWDMVQVASVQTLVRRLHKIHPPQLIISDECHHANAGTWRKIFEHFNKASILGVTATPCRLDGSGLGRASGGFFDDMVKGPSVAELIDRGFLARPRIYAPPIGADLANLRKKYGEFVGADVVAAMDKPVITGSAVEHYRKLASGVPA